MKMKPLGLLALLLTCFAHSAIATEVQDPYAEVEHLKLENGMNVYLAHSDDAKLVEIRLEVAVGTEVEDKSNFGVSHLLEHVLFRDKDLKDEMSYLQVIKEAGGKANGQTTERYTSFFASIPYAKSDWLMQSFAKMLLEPDISDDYVKKEKGTVELERGRPSPIAEVLGFDILKYLSLNRLARPVFNETEFGIKKVKEYTLTEEQLSTRRLTKDQVLDHYKAYYYPKNMNLFVAGRFDRTAVMNELKGKWSHQQYSAGKTLPPLPTAFPRLAAYKQSTHTDGTPNVTIGTKLWEISIEEQEIAHSYVSYLAHRLMKEIRNLKGQTYAAHAGINVVDRHGTVTVEFETRPENYAENLAMAEEHLRSEAQVGGLSPTQVKEAVDLYIAQYGLMGREAEDMMGLAQGVHWIDENYGAYSSPFDAIKSVKPEQYNAALKKLFAPDRAYRALAPPPLFFRYDTFLLSALTAIATFVVLRRLLTKSFQNNRLQWVRKIKYPPLKLLEILTFTLALYASFYINYLIRLFEISIQIDNFPLLISDYCTTALENISTIAVVAGIVSLVPRKLMVMNGFLVIKSLSYHSKKIPLNEIKSVETARLNPFAFRRWWSVKHRFAFYNPGFWQQGMLVHLKNGQSYFFSTSTPLEVAAELRGFLPPPEQSTPAESLAA